MPEDLAASLLHRCRQAGLTAATAESCTGGLIFATLTGVSGASAVMERGFITYTNQAKMDLLAVPAETLADHGAVSAPVARAMVAGALDAAPVDLAVAVTGIAGPSGGTPEKPVGLVHLAAARRDGRTDHAAHHFDGDRTAVRQATVTTALAMLDALV